VLFATHKTFSFAYRRGKAYRGGLFYGGNHARSVFWTGVRDREPAVIDAAVKSVHRFARRTRFTFLRSVRAFLSFSARPRVFGPLPPPPSSKQLLRSPRSVRRIARTEKTRPTTAEQTTTGLLRVVPCETGRDVLRKTRRCARRVYTSRVVGQAKRIMQV